MRIKQIILSMACAISLAACSNGGNSSGSSNSDEKLNYPASEYTDASNTYFGTNVPDPYQWMENTNSSKTLSWVNQQNVFTDNYIQNLPEYKSVSAELAALVSSTKSIMAENVQQDFVKVDNKYFYTNFHRTNDTRPYSIYSKDKISTDNIIYVTDNKDHKGKVFLDLNKSGIAKGNVSVVQFGIINGPVSYTVVRTQDENLDLSTITLINNQTQTPVKVIKDVNGSFEIYNNGFFYVQSQQVTDIYTSSYSSQILFYDQVGSSSPVQVFDPGSAAGMINIQLVVNNILYFATGYASGFNRIYSFDASDLSNTPQVLLEGEIPASFRIISSNQDGSLLVETNQGAALKRWITVNPNSPASSDWTNIVPPNPENVIANYITSCGNYYYAEILEDGASKLYRYDQTVPAANPVEIDGFPGLGALETEGDNSPKCVDNSVLTYSYSNLVTPHQSYQYNPATQSVGELKSQSTIPGFNPADYEMKELFVPSTGGAVVSIFIGYKKGLKLNGNNPALIYLYGGFNTSTLPSFDTNTVLLMKNGGIYVVAQVRGGGEYGTVWYNDGRMLNKQNTYNDVAAVANYLINNGYTNPSKLALSGSSNGGLTTAAVALQNPGLFKVVFPAVGVLDLLRYQLFTTGFVWYPDYGYSSVQDQFNNLMAFSPLQNVRSISYPAMLIQTGMEDGRVPPLHSYKFAATMQNMAGGTSPYLLRSYFGLGHQLQSNQVEIDKWTMFFNQTETPLH